MLRVSQDNFISASLQITAIVIFQIIKKSSCSYDFCLSQSREHQDNRWACFYERLELSEISTISTFARSRMKIILLYNL